MTPAKKREFKLQNPADQKFTKTDLAKYSNCWGQKPHLVSQGAEKNFRNFTIEMNKDGYSEPTKIEFETLVSKAILYRQAEKIVTRKAYGGYRANTVAYTIALLSFLRSGDLEFSLIWNEQSLNPVLEEVIGSLSELVREVIVNAPGNGNVTEWCKKVDCWNEIKKIDYSIPEIPRSVSVISLEGIEHPIVELLLSKGHALDKDVIMRSLGISPSDWNDEIRELLAGNIITKTGRGRDTLYSVAN